MFSIAIALSPQLKEYSKAVSSIGSVSRMEVWKCPTNSEYTVQPRPLVQLSSYKLKYVGAKLPSIRPSSMSLKRPIAIDARLQKPTPICTGVPQSRYALNKEITI